MSTSTPSILRNAASFAIGVLLVGYAAQTYFWHGYMLANPAVGMPSTSSGFSILLLGMFLGGSGLIYVSLIRGLAGTLDSRVE